MSSVLADGAGHTGFESSQFVFAGGAVGSSSRDLNVRWGECEVGADCANGEGVDGVEASRGELGSEQVIDDEVDVGGGDDSAVELDRHPHLPALHPHGDQVAAGRVVHDHQHDLALQAQWQSIRDHRQLQVYEHDVIAACRRQQLDL